MSDAGNEAEGEIEMDLNKMKMSELKGELAARGLKISGKKSELVDRLQQYLEEHEDAEVEDEFVMSLRSLLIKHESVLDEITNELEVSHCEI